MVSEIKITGDTEDGAKSSEQSSIVSAWQGLAEAVPASAETLRDPRVESLAIPLARDYAEKNYQKREDGTFEPAWRGVNGEKQYKGKSPEQLVAEFGMTPEEAASAVIDIANQPYNEYSDYWKNQNRGGAEFLVGLMDARGVDTLRGLDLTDPAVREEYGTLIHDNWLAQNEWVKDPTYGDPVLAKPFAELPPAEQQKDIDHLDVLQKWLSINPQTADEWETKAHELSDLAAKARERNNGTNDVTYTAATQTALDKMREARTAEQEQAK